jgi:hypothetical protein
MPGASALTRMRCPASSYAAIRTSWFTAAFVAEYAARPGRTVDARIEVTARIAWLSPAGSASMRRAAAWQVRNVPVRFRSTKPCQSSRDISANGLMLPEPALATKTFRCGMSSAIAAKPAAMESGWLVSIVIQCTCSSARLGLEGAAGPHAAHRQVNSRQLTAARDFAAIFRGCPEPAFDERAA